MGVADGIDTSAKHAKLSFTVKSLVDMSSCASTGSGETIWKHHALPLAAHGPLREERRHTELRQPSDPSLGHESDRGMRPFVDHSP